LKEKVAALVQKTEITAVEIRRADRAKCVYQQNLAVIYDKLWLLSLYSSLAC
jgi:hypothetical protein